jgi:ankyrin repeat protein
MTRQFIPALTLMGAFPMMAAAQMPPQPDAKAALNRAELFIAIRDNDAAGVKKSLAQGADPNSRNWLDFSALMWAAMCGNREIAETLITHGAKFNDDSIYGSALTFAEVGRREEMALFLLDKGIKPDPSRLDKASPLMIAAANGHVKLMDRLLKQKVSPNAQDSDGATALIYAAQQGQTSAVQMLIQNGANISTADSHKRTALHYAAMNGWAQTTDALIERGADVHAKDAQGATPLLLAARYNGDKAIVSRLLKSGANASLTDHSGMTAFALAQSRGYKDAASLLRKFGTKNAAFETVAFVQPRSAAKAVENSLAVLQSGMKTFGERAQCVSCHHQGLGMMTLGFAAQRGFLVDKELMGKTMKQIGEEGQQGAAAIHQALSDPHIGKMIPAVDIGDFAVGAGWIFGAPIANGIPANPGFAELAQFLTQQQTPKGSWKYGFDRGPMQSSYLTTTALNLQILHTYGQPDKVKDSMARAKNWLMQVATPNAEDKAARLLGLKWAGASDEEIAKARRDVIAAQKPDGGWSATPTLRSDAYATGFALYALAVGGGLSVNEAAYQRGVHYLLRTQDEDGSWYVMKRTTPANTYMDAGFPHGESQYSSFAGTCWATLALLQVASVPQTALR